MIMSGIEALVARDGQSHQGVTRVAMQAFLYQAIRINTVRLYHQARSGVKAVEMVGMAHHRTTKKDTIGRRVETETAKGSESETASETTSVNMTDESGITNGEKEEEKERGKGDVIHRHLNHQDLMSGVTREIVHRQQFRRVVDGRNI